MRLRARSVRRDLLLVLGLVSAMSVGSTCFGLWLARRTSRLVEGVFADYLALSRCSGQVLLAQLEGTASMSRALTLRGAGAAQEIEAIRARFVASMHRSATFLGAMIWGSESEAFRRGAGGALAAAWYAQGGVDAPVVRPAPPELRQLAGLCDIYLAAYGRRVMRVLDGCAQAGGATGPEAEARRAALEPTIREAYEYRRLAAAMMQQSLGRMHGDLQEAAGMVRRAQSQAALLLVSVLLLTGAASLAFGWVFATVSIVRPLERLRAGTEVIGKGDLGFRVGTDAPDEIGQLSRAFDAMVENLKSVMARRDELDREVARREQAEAELVRALENLKRSNAELEQFAYVASHDLQEPLRKITSFGGLLAAEAGASLNAEARDYLDRMLGAVRRMQALINDLLALSRVSTRGQPPVPVDLNRTLAEVVSDLESRVTAAGARVEVGPLPTIEADPVQMHQLFQNLVGNAVKFRREGVAPVVRVYAAAGDPPGSDAGDAVDIVVEDNGIGFEDKYAERIFGVFQRLHNRTAYEGTGIGLAVCRKIVTRHGGTITARGTPGSGARFLVRLPRRASPDMTRGEPP